MRFPDFMFTRINFTKITLFIYNVKDLEFLMIKSINRGALIFSIESNRIDVLILNI